MAAAASQNLAAIQLVTVSLGEIWYHPEAILLGVPPTSLLEPLHNAAKTATRKITRTDGLADGPGGWRPRSMASLLANDLI